MLNWNSYACNKINVNLKPKNSLFLSDKCLGITVNDKSQVVLTLSRRISVLMNHMIWLLINPSKKTLRLLNIIHYESRIAIQINRKTKKQSKLACTTTATMICLTVVSVKMYSDRSYRTKMINRIRTECYECLSNNEISKLLEEELFSQLVTIPVLSSIAQAFSLYLFITTKVLNNLIIHGVNISLFRRKQSNRKDTTDWLLLVSFYW